MASKPSTILATLAILLNSTSTRPHVTRDWTDLSQISDITYVDHTWSFQANVVRIEQVSALGSRGRGALLTYLEEAEGDANYVWVLLDLQGCDYLSANEAVASQNVVVYVSGNYVNERGINYDLCSNESGNYCTVLTLVEGAFPKSIDLHNLPASPGNRLIYHGSSSRNWWNGMLAWKIAVQ